MIDIAVVIESGREITVTKLEDGSYSVSIMFDISKELSFLNAFYMVETAYGLPFTLSTTECKAILTISEDYYVSAMDLEFDRAGSYLYTDYDGSKKTILLDIQ